MEENNVTPQAPDLSSLLGQLLSNKELMSKIGEIAGNSTPSDTPQPPPPSIDGLLSNPDVMSKLPDVISVIKPLLSNESTAKSKHQSVDKHLALLMALKPYLSSKRCEAIDYISKMSKLSQTVKGLKL